MHMAASFFASSHKSHEDVFPVICVSLKQAAELVLLDAKIRHPRTHRQHCDYIRPKHSRELNLRQTITHLTGIFEDETLIVKGTNIQKSSDRQRRILLCKHVQSSIMWAIFVEKLSHDQFESVKLISGLNSSKGGDINSRLLDLRHSSDWSPLEYSTSE